MSSRLYALRLTTVIGSVAACSSAPASDDVNTTQPIDELEFDLNAFIQDAVKRPGALQSSWYLSNVFAGFEVWGGGVGLKTKAFYAIVE